MLLEAATKPYPLASSETIRRTAIEIIQRPEFKLDRRIYEQASIWEELQDWFERLLRPIGKAFEGLYNVSPVLAWLALAGLLLLAFVLLAHVVYTFKAALTSRRGKRAYSSLASKAEQDPALWERYAAQAASRGEYIDAVRHLFRASLLRIERARGRVLRPSVTNREFLKRHEGGEAFKPLSLFVQTIDSKWYGSERCSEMDFRLCAEAHSAVCALARETSHVDPA